MRTELPVIDYILNELFISPLASDFWLSHIHLVLSFGSVGTKPKVVT